VPVQDEQDQPGAVLAGPSEVVAEGLFVPRDTVIPRPAKAWVSCITGANTNRRPTDNTKKYLLTSDSPPLYTSVDRYATCRTPAVHCVLLYILS